MFYDRNPGDARVKVGSERKVATSRKRPTRAEFRCRRYRGLLYTLLRGGTLQIWPCYMGTYSHKIPYTTVGFCSV